ncbi:N-acyl homoserine lactonase family protein [Paractinoplanes globisporus]|uniref:N-acyl homoserine lactonase family protein n=1 Tax=Paractinoplanes globisporus TaxID=113565 RepID=A0ABW6WLE9_9ACTN|nr:N-acyl homoserine lactonase family protein [Actinoplanes globisporus]
MADIVVRRVDLGYFVRPASETGTEHARVEPTLGYLIEHPIGLVLVDTGMGRHPEVDAHYRPRRIPLTAALRTAGAKLDDIEYVVNCHLHFDHCGGNPELAGRPVFTQRSELSLARTTEHTIPELIDHPGARYEELDGEAEILPGVVIVPTPGHTAGHQSVVVTRRDGTIVVAGQSHDNASLFTGDVLSQRAGVGHHPVWIDRLLAFDPRQVVFAHDNAVWTPGTSQVSAS